jgi:transposase
VEGDQKKAHRLSAWLVFIDESGLLLLPVVRRTWSRRGHTPVLWLRGRHRQKVSVIAALCGSPDRHEVRLYFHLLVDAAFNAAAVLIFVKHLAPQLGRPMVLVWDRSQTHRGPVLKTLLAGVQSMAVHFPPYAPELNPVEYLWSYLKTKPLANLACPDVDQLAVVSRRDTRSLQHKSALLRSFIHHTPLSLRLR